MALSGNQLTRLSQYGTPMMEHPFRREVISMIVAAGRIIWIEFENRTMKIKKRRRE